MLSKNPEQKPLSILLLGSQMAVGGAQRVLLDQAQWFHNHGYKVQVAFFYDKETLHQKWQEISAFPIHNLRAFQPGRNRFVNAVSLFVGLWGLWKLIRCEKFDVVETFTYDSNILGQLVAWMAGVSVRMATHHGRVEGLPRSREAFHTWLVNNNIANLLVAVSEKTQRKALKEGVNPECIFVVRNGIVPVSMENANRFEVRKEMGLREDDIFLLSVGRLVYQKAHEILLAAMPAVLEKYPNTKAGICGDGPLHSKLEAQIDSLRLAESVKLLGKFDSVTKFLLAADVFVLPSRWEGLPIALLEAMSAGLPVIATCVEGVDEVIRDGENGLLVPVEDIGALSKAILRLAGDPDVRHQMGLAAHQCVNENYALDRMCEEYLKLMKTRLK
jgi:glycosyltransferase involved in cell wall biosynthesis